MYGNLERINMDQEIVKEIQSSIKWRVERGETRDYRFYITTPKIFGEDNDENIKELLKIFDKYNIGYSKVDTVYDFFDLNREWYMTDIPIECSREYSGVYPVNWEISDVIKLKELDEEGKIIILVPVFKEFE